MCAQCRYPAANETIFRGLESPYVESPKCPKCGSVEIIPDRSYAYRWGWHAIHQSGAAKKMQEIPGTFLQLEKIGDEQPKGSMKREDLPPNVAQEFDKKSDAINKVLKESGVLEKLAELGVNVRYHITVFESK